MDTSALDRGSSATLGSTDLKAVRHREQHVIYKFLTLLVAIAASLAED
jgi:hypothetical protein